MSFNSVSNISELFTTMSQYSARSSCDNSSLCMSDEKPTMALSGVRISWLMLARNADLSMSDSSAPLPGDDQLPLALFERPFEPLHTQQQPRHEQQQQDQQQDAQHEQFDVMGVFRELGGYRILHDAALRKGVFGDLPLFELARIEEVDILAGMECTSSILPVS